MGAPIFGFRNFIDLAGTSLSGGDWRTSLPLANVQDQRLEKVARSVSAATGDTLFDVDLGAARFWRAVCLILPNLSLAGRVRFRLFTSPPTTGQVYDSTLLNPFEVYPSNVLQQGHPAAGGTTLAQEDLDDGYRPHFYHVLSTETEARYARFEIQDAANTDSYLDIGRAFGVYGYKPTHGMSVGAKLGWTTDTRKTRTRGGATIKDILPSARRFDFSLNQFSADESLVYLDEVNRYCGTGRQLLFVGDDEDTVHMHRRSMVCTIDRMQPLSFRRTVWNDQAFSLIEEL